MPGFAWGVVKRDGGGEAKGQGADWLASVSRASDFHIHPLNQPRIENTGGKIAEISKKQNLNLPCTQQLFTLDLYGIYNYLHGIYMV